MIIVAWLLGIILAGLCIGLAIVQAKGGLF